MSGPRYGLWKRKKRCQVYFRMKINLTPFCFFNRNVGSDAYENVDIFWVDAQVIEDLRPSNLSSIINDQALRVGTAAELK